MLSMSMSPAMYRERSPASQRCVAGHKAGVSQIWVACSMTGPCTMLLSHQGLSSVSIEVFGVVHFPGDLPS